MSAMTARTRQPTSGPHVLRSLNRTAVLGAVRATEGPVSVASLMTTTGLSRPAVTRALSDLERAALIERLDADQQGAVGRPAGQVRFRAELGHVAGLEVGPHRVQVLLADLQGQIVAQLEVGTASAGATVVSDAVTAVEDCATRAGIALDSLWCLAVGTPGVVNDAGEVTVAPSISGWAGLSVVATLRERFGCPVLIDNDMNYASRAEGTHGAAKGSDTYAYVHWGTRVGAGLVLDGRPYRGATSAAGELGFIDLAGNVDRTPERPTKAGTDGAGSFERLVGAAAIRDLAIQMAEEAGSAELLEAVTQCALEDVTARLFERAAGGDETAAAITRRVTSRFSAGLAVLTMLLDPSLVVIGGGVARAGEALLAAVDRDLGTRVISRPELALSQLGNRAVALGAIEAATGYTEERLVGLATVPQLDDRAPESGLGTG